MSSEKSQSGCVFSRSHGVVVITSALHAAGPGFDPQCDHRFCSANAGSVLHGGCEQHFRWGQASDHAEQRAQWGPGNVWDIGLEVTTSILALREWWRLEQWRLCAARRRAWFAAGSGSHMSIMMPVSDQGRVSGWLYSHPHMHWLSLVYSSTQYY